ncbi:MAG: hypothetical protein UZ14_CFX002001496 [Chloroflexi bacterium OLB14]|nr:MAG: hypothetical protein UZ14_CFX002001496 [Chloroflexi bacterium OLB14]
MSLPKVVTAFPTQTTDEIKANSPKPATPKLRANIKLVNTLKACVAKREMVDQAIFFFKRLADVHFIFES